MSSKIENAKHSKKQTDASDAHPHKRTSQSHHAAGITGSHTKVMPSVSDGKNSHEHTNAQVNHAKVVEKQAQSTQKTQAQTTQRAQAQSASNSEPAASQHAQASRSQATAAVQVTAAQAKVQTGAVRPVSTTSSLKPLSPKLQGAAGAAAYANASSYGKGAHPGAGAMQAPARKTKKPLFIGLAILVAVLVCAYVGVGVYFSSHFMPNTTMGPINVSLMSKAQAEEALSNKVSDYTLTVKGDSFEATYTADDMGLTLNSADVVQSALDMINSWAWPFELSEAHDVSEALVATHDQTLLSDLVSESVASYNESVQQPQNAYISYNADKQSFEIVPEEGGTAFDAQAVMEALDASVVELATQATLDENDYLQPTVFSNDASLLEALDKANEKSALSFTVTANGQTIAESNVDLIASWITFAEDYSLGWDSDAMNSWANTIAANCNTVGSTRTYTRPDGKVCTVSGGVYGWAVDSGGLVDQVISLLDSGQGGTIEAPCSQTADVVAQAGEQDWGSRYIDIDLAEQHVYFYDNGTLLWESDCVSGTPDGTNDTSVGVYWIENKESPSVLIGYEDGEKTYESEVEYWMPFDRNMVGLHDASWQTAFGGDRYATGYGSHGCVNLPTSKAAELYALIKIGDVVVSHW